MERDPVGPAMLDFFRLKHRLEGVVREYPTQWFNFFDIWDPLNG